MMRRIGALAASADWLEPLLARGADAPEDWRAALAMVEAWFPEALEEWRALAPQALAADLDPLSLPPEGRWARPIRAAGYAGCGPLRAETGHVEDVQRARWIVETLARPLAPSNPALERALDRLVRAETFERFMARRYPGRKRFGAEGSETLHVLLGASLDRAAELGVEEVVIAPMHRGRLGLHASLLGQPLNDFFALMNGVDPRAAEGVAGDLPYHLGLDSLWRAPAGEVRVTVLPNPSHLEAVNAVALGYARRRQERLGGPHKMLAIILHTDASVVAQGVVAEALQMSETAGHSVGGALHLIVDNQIGFTTDAQAARTSRWCAGPFKAVDSLILHLNGDWPEAAVVAARVALDFRSRFEADAVVDMHGVRANGHNELDEPRFTQPLYYARADRRQAISAGFIQRLDSPPSGAQARAEAVAADWRKALDVAFSGACGMAPAAMARAPTPPALPATVVEDVVRAMTDLADGSFHPRAVRAVAQRAAQWRDDRISWATAEILAIGRLLAAGRDIRLTGQDCERGAFSQRHLALVDAEGRRSRLFADAPPAWGRLTVVDTPLSEYAALGFAYGYSLAAPDGVTIWEAQFGDFANVTQVMFDQFIAAAAEKWSQRSNLVVLLPHGLEGQGPEHSSARIERFLQMAAKENLRLAQPSTPANWHHLLLSQTAEQRPLIVFTPKKLLRLEAAVSSRADIIEGAFQPVLAGGEAGAARVVICSGKIAHEAAAASARLSGPPVAIVRLEQLYPFPAAELERALAPHEGAAIVWLQEEPANFGAAAWLEPQLRALTGRSVGVVARRANPSPAGSFHARHDRDQAVLIEAALAGVPSR